MEEGAAADAVLTSMARDDSFADFIVDQLRDLPDIDCRAMFGAHGIYQDEVFFGIVAGGRLYFKTNAYSA
ncbi:MAG TPA: TfoX/Sxy family protein, partial [Candidatus Binatia bacterium]|nr:TfoX/Sxy family protein [Candidatus Binatia bacterium]